MTNAAVYPLGYSEGEARRLAWQAALLEDISRDMFLRAGLAEGMRVLDLGCGVGDVSFIASHIVGPAGAVLGVDRSAASVEIARARAEGLAIRNVAFEVAELATFETEQSFDAVIGRLFLLYIADPANLLRRMRPLLRRGGLVAFQEVDMSVASQEPPSELFARVNNWIFSAIDAGAAERDMGAKLLAAFLGAGLPRPSMRAVTPVESGPHSPYYEFLAQMVRSMMPVIKHAGIATPEEIDIETLAERLRDDAVTHERAMFPPRMVSAWTRLPGK